MLKTAVMQSMLDEKDAVLESLICFKRAGSSGIISYFSMQGQMDINLKINQTF